MKKRAIDTLVKRVVGMEHVFNKKTPRKIWWENLSRDISYKGFKENKAIHRNNWCARIHVAEIVGLRLHILLLVCLLDKYSMTNDMCL